MNEESMTDNVISSALKGRHMQNWLMPFLDQEGQTYLLYVNKNLRRKLLPMIEFTTRTALKDAKVTIDEKDNLHIVFPSSAAMTFFLLKYS
jgi:hypothetical protein